MLSDEGTGADPGFFLGRGALVSCSTSTLINHIVFSCRIPVVLENRSSSQGGGVHTPCTLPLDPPLRQCWRMVKNNTSNQQKSNFARGAHFFGIFFAVVSHNYIVKTSRNFLVTRFMEEMLYMFSFTFFYSRSFSPCIGGRQHLLFSHCCYKIFMLFFQQKKCLLCCLSLTLDLCRPFSR